MVFEPRALAVSCRGSEFASRSVASRPVSGGQLSVFGFSRFIFQFCAVEAYFFENHCHPWSLKKKKRSSAQFTMGI